MSIITIFRTKNPIEEQILVTVQAGTDPKKLSFRVEKSALLPQILLSVKRNMKAFEHVYYPDIYFCDPISGDIVGMETPLAPYHGKVLIARARASLCEDLMRSCLLGCGMISDDEDARFSATTEV